MGCVTSHQRASELTLRGTRAACKQRHGRQRRAQLQSLPPGWCIACRCGRVHPSGAQGSWRQRAAACRSAGGPALSGRSSHPLCFAPILTMSLTRLRHALHSRLSKAPSGESWPHGSRRLRGIGGADGIGWRARGGGAADDACGRGSAAALACTNALVAAVLVIVSGVELEGDRGDTVTQCAMAGR